MSSVQNRINDHALKAQHDWAPKKKKKKLMKSSTVNQYALYKETFINRKVKQSKTQNSQTTGK